MKNNERGCINCWSGQIAMAIVRRIGTGKKLIIGDKNEENAKQITKIMNDAGFDCEAIIVDLASIHLFEKCSFKKDKKKKKGWSYSLQIDA